MTISPCSVTVLERFFSRKERRRLFHSWAGSASMWVKVTPALLSARFRRRGAEQLMDMSQGGSAVWGNATFAPDDLDDKDHSHGSLIAFRENVVEAEAHEHLFNMTADDAGSWILERTPSYFQVV